MRFTVSTVSRYRTSRLCNKARSLQRLGLLPLKHLHIEQVSFARRAIAQQASSRQSCSFFEEFHVVQIPQAKSFPKEIFSRVGANREYLLITIAPAAPLLRSAASAGMSAVSRADRTATRSCPFVQFVLRGPFLRGGSRYDVATFQDFLASRLKPIAEVRSREAIVFVIAFQRFADTALASPFFLALSRRCSTSRIASRDKNQKASLV